jgi:transposase
MLTTLTGRKIYVASQPIDFRMSINALSGLIERNKQTWLHDGSMYVFYNKGKDKIKILFWDRNGFVLYYKRLDNTKFKFKVMTENLSDITPDELEVILSGYDPSTVGKEQLALITQ